MGGARFDQGQRRLPFRGPRRRVTVAVLHQDMAQESQLDLLARRLIWFEGIRCFEPSSV